MLYQYSNKKIILFDGLCNFCSSQVFFIIKYEKKEDFLFAPLQSEVGKKIIPQSLRGIVTLDSIVLIENNELFIESGAVLTIARYLRFPWSLFYYLIFLPKFIRDPVYRIFAKNRYKWFGKKEICFIPTENIKNRFIDHL